MNLGIPTTNNKGIINMNDMFLTNHYRVLEIMNNNIVKVGKNEYCPLGQGDIAEELNVSRASVNSIFADLRDAGYISMITRGKWTLSSDAVKIIDCVQKV